MSIYNIADFGFSYPFSPTRLSLSGNCSIEQGDCILLQGASGSGKSTLLAALRGLIPQVIFGQIKGQIKFKDQDLTSLNETDLLRIGYLQQNPDSQLVCSQVYAELAFGLENLALSPAEIERKIRQFSRDFQLEHLLDRKVASLSGGEKQKVNLVAILLLEPEVLLLDEPTAFLDPESAQQIMAVIAKYLRNKTVIIVEHNLSYVAELVNRSLYIDASGAIKEQSLHDIEWFTALPRLGNSSPPIPLQENSTTLLKIDNLNFAYQNGKSILQQCNLELRVGEISAIIGKNGSGKSTLLKLIANVLPSTQQIYWQTQDIASYKRRKLWQQLSLVWQNPESHFIYESVSREVADNPLILAKFNLSAQSKHNPFCLSEGQKRRLSLAICLNAQRQLILLDEPTFGQDYANKLQLANIIREMSAHGISFLVVSHDLDFVHALSDKIYRLENGQLQPC